MKIKNKKRNCCRQQWFINSGDIVVLYERILYYIWEKDYE